MAKFLIVLCAVIACAAAKPGVIGTPLAYTAPLAFNAPVAAAYAAPVVASPLAYANAHLDAAYASQRVDIKQNYNSAIVPTTFAAPAPIAPVAPLKYTAYSAPVAAAYTAPVAAAYTAPVAAAYTAPVAAAYAAPVAAAYTAPVAAAPLAYANAHLDAAYASQRVDIKQNYNSAIVPTTFAAAAPVAPLKYTAYSAPVAATYAAPAVAPVASVSPVAPVAPLKYTAASSIVL